MARRNRVDPWGDLHAVADRGMFTGNRGCLVDDSRRLVRHHASNLWITCLTSYRGWWHPLDQPHRWTPLFFLDDAVALAAGHRPCALCRSDAYRGYRDAVTESTGAARPLLAHELNRRLAAERLERGRGIERAADRRTWTMPAAELPDGTVIVHSSVARLVMGAATWAFGFDGWTDPVERTAIDVASVLTPPTSVAALRHGFRPVIHPSAAAW